MAPPVMILPSISTYASAASGSAISLSSVDFPFPSSPMIAQRSPWPRVKERPLIIGRRSFLWVTDKFCICKVFIKSFFPANKKTAFPSEKSSPIRASRPHTARKNRKSGNKKCAICFFGHQQKSHPFEVTVALSVQFRENRLFTHL